MIETRLSPLNKRFFVMLLGVMLLLGLVATGGAQRITCPTPRNQVRVTVNATAAFDPTTSLYTYEYTVTNASSSRQEVSDFALDFAPPISSIFSPHGWTHGQFFRRSTIHWAATLAAPLPPGVPDTGQVPPGEFQIKPSSSLGGFSFQSPRQPGPVNFYVLGFADLAVARDESEAETLADRCPQSVGGFFDMAVTGTTQGPAMIARPR